MKYITAKRMLSHVKKGSDTWFGIRYQMNLYRGCQHGCIYCDSRSICYQIQDFTNIEVKENALMLLDRELDAKRQRGTVGTGSMNDPYMPIEEEIQLTRGALELIWKYRFPVHILTKSDLVLRDLDLLKKINQVYGAVSFTITTCDDDLAAVIEPGAPSPTARLEAMKRLSDAGIYTGVLLMPVLPFITDTVENIERIVHAGNKNGASYILPSMGMTLREGSREYYYEQLDQNFPGLKAQYMKQYGQSYGCYPQNYKLLYNRFNKACKKVDMPMKMRFYEEKKEEQMDMFDMI